MSSSLQSEVSASKERPLIKTPVSRANLDAGGNSRITALGRSAYMQAMEDGWADHRRLHTEGRKARAIYDAARETVAGTLGTKTDDIHFSASATSAFHTAIQAIHRGRQRVGNRSVLSAIERSAAINAAREFGEPELIAVDRQGHVDVDSFMSALAQPGTALATIQQANHEVGTLQPLDRISAAAKAQAVPLLVDATSSIGHVQPPSYRDWDALIAQPADWGAGSGVGVLAIKPRTRYRRTWPEDQDHWFPGGTSLAAIFSAAVTLSEAESLRQERAKVQHDWIARIRAAAALIPDTEVVGDPEARLPHMATFSFLYVDGEAITSELDKRGFAVGSGSACTSASLEPSHVLGAMGVLTHGNVRVSLDWDVNEEDINRFIAELPDAVSSVRQMMGIDFQ